MLGLSVSHVNYCLTIARKLKSELDENNKPKADAKFWNCDSLADAWRLWLREKENILLAELAKRQQELAGVDTFDSMFDSRVEQSEVFSTPISDTITGHERTHILALRERAAAMGYLALNESEAKTLYLSNPLNPP